MCWLNVNPRYVFVVGHCGVPIAVSGRDEFLKVVLRRIIVDCRTM